MKIKVMKDHETLVKMLTEAKIKFEDGLNFLFIRDVETHHVSVFVFDQDKLADFLIVPESELEATKRRIFRQFQS